MTLNQIAREATRINRRLLALQKREWGFAESRLASEYLTRLAVLDAMGDEIRERKRTEEERV
jgi:hypothetical protein